MHNIAKIKNWRPKTNQLISTVLLVMFTFIYYYAIGRLNMNHNVFNTIKGWGLDFILGNLAWIAFYAAGEVFILLPLQQLYLATNPMLAVRYSSRKQVFFQGLRINLVSSLFFAAAYGILQYLTVGGQADLPLLGDLWLESALSLAAFILLLLNISLLGGEALGWQISIILLLAALWLKSNWLVLLTQPESKQSSINLVWLVILIIANYFLNEYYELR